MIGLVAPRVVIVPGGELARAQGMGLASRSQT